jgi:hypothetical protein
MITVNQPLITVRATQVRRGCIIICNARLLRIVSGTSVSCSWGQPWFQKSTIDNFEQNRAVGIGIVLSTYILKERCTAVVSYVLFIS